MKTQYRIIDVGKGILTLDSTNLHKVIQPDLTQADVLLINTPPTRVDNTFTYPANSYKAIINNIVYINNDAFSVDIVDAPLGYSRVDIVYITEGGIIGYIKGVESQTNIIYTTLPSGFIALSNINVNGDVIDDPLPVVGDPTKTDKGGYGGTALDLYNYSLGLDYRVSSTEFSITELNASVSDLYLNKEDRTNKGIPNGYTPLDGNNKVPLIHINDALLGNVQWKGLYNGTIITSSPDSTLVGTALPAPSSSNKGWYFISIADYTYSSIDYKIGDWIISNGITWDKVDNTDAVSSVFGRVGNIIAQVGDYTTALVTETANKNYQTDTQKLYNDATSSIQTQLNARALDSTVVHKAGDETITGIKTFFSIETNFQTSAGSCIRAIHGSSANGIVSIASAGATGNNFIGYNDTSVTFTVDKLGVITGISHIKSGAPATNILLAGGGDIPQSTFALASGSGSYIQNQNASAQSADMWISGLIKTNLGSGGLSLSGNTAPDEVFIGNNYYNINGTEFDGGGRDSWRVKFKNVITSSNSLFSVDYRAANAAAGAFTSFLTVKGDGNVGIGTNNPITKLNVHGGTGDGVANSPRISLTRTSSVGNVLSGKIALDQEDVNFGNIVFKVKTTASSAESDSYYTDALTIRGVNGNVGIGTTNPLSKLDVNGDIRISNNANFLQFTPSSGLAGIGTVSSSALNFYVGSGLETRMSILQNGNVGIGGNPVYGKLELVNPSFGTQTFAFSTPDGSANPRAFIQHITSGSSQRVNFTSTFSSSAGVANWTFENGNVLIGTTTDNGVNKLQVNGSSSIRPNTSGLTLSLFHNNIGSNAVPLSNKISWFTSNSVECATIDVPDSRSNVLGVPMIFKARNDAGTLIEWMRIANGGNVGIGTTSPTGKLNVWGASDTIPAIAFSDYPSFGWGILERSTDGDLEIRRTQSTSNFSVMKMIRSNGNVLIGTITDNGVDKLQVNGSGRFASTNEYNFKVQRTGISKEFSFGSDTNSFYIKNTTDSVFNIFFNNNGSVNIPNLSGTDTRTVVADASGNLSAGTIAPTSGTYTPTVTPTNITINSSTVVANYSRVGNIVTVQVSMEGTPVASQIVIVAITLPFVRVGSSTLYAGGGFIWDTSPSQPVVGHTRLLSPNNASLYYRSGTGTLTHYISINFQYDITQ